MSFLQYFILTVLALATSSVYGASCTQIWGILGALFAVYASQGGLETLYLFCATIRRDAIAVARYLKFRLHFRRFCGSTKSIHAAFTETVHRFPNKVCFVQEKRQVTFQQLDRFSTSVALLLQGKLKLKPCEVVALFMHNRPEYVGTWLGASKAGCVTALINNNIRLEVLLHSIKAAQCVALIYDRELASAVLDIKDKLLAHGVRHLLAWDEADSVQLNAFDPALNTLHMNAELNLIDRNSQQMSEFKPFEAEANGACLYIYTSGTTGMPKAAVLRHKKYFQFSKGAFLMFGMTSDDVIYDPLPLYHTAGGMVGVGMALLSGCTLVLRTKFSASQFWDECAAHKCTVAQYLGETCRYLLNQPERPSDRAHKVRFMFGNGLRPQIWRAFQSRFGVKIGEFYGATEGIANIINHMNKEGACGFVSVILPAVYPITLVRVDTDTGEPLRDSNGLCMICQPGEPGMMVAKIKPGLFDFDGYTDKSASDKKVISDVFRKGDRAFASGDVLITDRYGYLYFLDRIGDTFRWKGENVSTTEVEGVIINILDKQDVVVYGVEVPGCEGRAGMVAIKVSDEERNGNCTDKLDWDRLTTELDRRLPAYARPLFVRLVRSLEATGTFKLKKNELRAVGFKPLPADSNTVSLHVFLTDKRCYAPLTPELYKSILDGKLRF